MEARPGTHDDVAIALGGSGYCWGANWGQDKRGLERGVGCLLPLTVVMLSLLGMLGRGLIHPPRTATPPVMAAA